MPGPWVFLKENRDFYESLTIPRGAYLDTHLYDGAHQQQGYGLWRVSSCDKKRKEGWWIDARLIAVSDDHLNWWLREGPGADKNRKFNLHLCAEAEANCRKTKRQPDFEFHTDYFRVLDVGDIHEKCLAWAKTGKAKDDLEAEQARLQGTAPRGRGSGATGSKPHGATLEWSVSDDGGGDSNEGDAKDIRRKLDALKRQVEKELPEGKRKTEKEKEERTEKKAEKPKKKKKASNKKKKQASKKTKQKRRKRSRSASRPDVRWFGRARKGSPPSSTVTSSSSEEESSESEVSGRKSKKSSGAKGKKNKKRKRSDTDRGPYGVGTRLRYDGKTGSSGSGDDSEEDESGSHFRAGLSTKSQQLQLLEYAEKRPGRLAARLLQKMDKILSRQESPMNQQDGKNLTPSTGTSYFLTVLVPQYREKLSLRTSRELRSTAKALDLIAQGHQDRAADVLAQRYKALEVSLADQSWSRAQHLELIPAEGAILTEHDELVMATREQKDEIRMRNMVSGSQWRTTQRYDTKGDEKGKSKGKGKGKKGQRTNHGGAGTENDKPPPKRKGDPATAHEQKAQAKGSQSKDQLGLVSQKPPVEGEQPLEAKPAGAVVEEEPSKAGGSKALSPRAEPAAAGSGARSPESFDPEVPSQLSEDMEGTPVNLFKVDFDIARTLSEWTGHVKEIFKHGGTFADLGRQLLSIASSLPTALGNFVRSYCAIAAQPSPSEKAKVSESHGDLLPIHPESVTLDIEGVTANNIDWVKLMIICIDYHYCVGWSKPICVPFKVSLTPNQKRAISGLADTVTNNIVTADPLPSLGECDKLLSSKKFDYAGKPVEYMEDLVCERVLPAWPKKGQAGIQPIEDFLSPETREVFDHPEKLLLPTEVLPKNALRSRVRATDHEWFHLVKEAALRGMMKPVDDSLVPRDKSGHLVTNGAGGVLKEKMVDGQLKKCQRFISIMCPVNAITEPISGSQDTLPYIGQMTGLMLEESESLYLESEDLQSAFNLFSIPPKWYGYFAYSKKVDQSAFGLPAGKLVRPCLSVVPMGWHSAVALVQEAVRELVFNRAGVPRHLSVEKSRALPASKNLAVVYLDNFDEIRIIQTLDADLSAEGKEMSDHHQNFNRVCDEAGLPRNLGKQLIHAFSGGMQGGHFDGLRGILKVGPDKLRNYIMLSLCLLTKRQWGEFHLRHWTGKTAFMATFKRSLFAGMGKIFEAVEESRRGAVSSTAPVVDEIFTLMCQSVLSQANLRATLSLEVSCTDASPYGGGSGVASKLKANPTLGPKPVEYDGTCGQCAAEIDPDTLDTRYRCPSKCGRICCSIFCLSRHRKSCPRCDQPRRVFGERFSGPDFPLTKAMGLRGALCFTGPSAHGKNMQDVPKTSMRGLKFDVSDLAAPKRRSRRQKRLEEEEQRRLMEEENV
eukprot:Skav231119  [mRNA]  locus=scaffold7:90570:104623:- [translate_table: standard]